LHSISYSPVDTEREALFPTGKLVDQIDVAGIGVLDATMINAGIPTIFINASAIGYKGTELQEQINSDADALAKFERIRTAGALAMGLIATPEEGCSAPAHAKGSVCCPCPRLYGFKR
jgi:2-methylaconitate cis-trans-isomerase PrpF